MTMTADRHTAATPRLDPVALPLTGSRLIEASAGTGKTFTIALLYLRLVLGPRNEDDAASFPRPLTPPEILVVTFTNAATQELRDRIRARLVEAADAFQPIGEDAATEAPDDAPDLFPNETGDLFAEPAVDNSRPEEDAPPSSDSPGGDPLIALRNSYPRESWPSCARRLRLAAEWMDEAAVSTIHAWCHRMLREHAFDSGSLFALEMSLDQSEMDLEIARDYWRSFYYDLDPEALQIVARYWTTPDTLNDTAARLRTHAAALPVTPPPFEALANYREQRAEALAELKAPWAAWLDELEELLEAAAKRKAFNGQKLNARSRANWIRDLRDWASDPELAEPKLTDAAWKRLTPDGIAEIWKEDPVPNLPALEALEALPDKLAELPDPFADLLAHAVHWMAARRETVQRRRAELGPDDLLHRLDAAFAGEAGKTLAARIREQFPVALVDEFQDTDPVQYRLFDRVYELAKNRDDSAASGAEKSAVLLIGDPKQAIYAFRGADIHTYLQARRDTAGRHVTLGTNFRSAATMVAAVNRVFEHAEQSESGAFLFRRGDDNPVPFFPVDANGRKDALVRHGAPQPALTLWHLASDETLAKGAYLKELAGRCASEMASLLREGQAGQTGFVENGELTPLAPSDLAVLVNNAGEARAIRAALLARGIRSVYLSDKEGVFETEAAAELEVWLAACAAPDDERCLRAALATPSLGLSLAELDALNGGPQQDELAWEARVMQFRDYHRQWQRRGVLPMLHRLLADFAVPGRLLAVPEGERRLTDLLHLGELLQEASAEIDGEHALLRFLAESRAHPQAQSDTHRLRLESDADLVQVVTIHKSKGLEYPLVFLPFIAAFRPVKAGDLPLRWHDDAGHLRLTLSADEATLARADHERLGEDLRKLYVALTRARHATWLGLAPLEAMERSAIGHLIAGGEALTPESLRPALEALAADDDTGNHEATVTVRDAPEADATPVQLASDDTPLGEARAPTRAIREHWWIASYSALRTGATPDDESEPAAEAEPSPEPTTATEATAMEVLDEPFDAEAATVSEGSLHRFPRGPSAGTFLHGLLEWAGEEGFARVAVDDALRADTLARRANRRGWEGQIPALEQWLPELLSTPLPMPGEGSPLRLDALDRATDYRIELEFWFAAHQVNTRRLDALVSTHTLGGRSRPALEPDTLNGMLKGFIDLVVEHEGRFHVLDWKSNHLGADDAAYTAAAMAEAVLDKRYDVQYCLYLLALHRLLEARLPDYDIERHLGGALYVFLRGTRAPSRGVHDERPPSELILALDALFRAEEAAA
ncbi:MULTISPECIES: exodeoxyribonuclease V subunit beta [unclassified Modicisalibacter]|uniref:exodeoxyribonuclease V subunit beta n=1 Tax=unclassified Modicisalibacter TaxID=2679913 RepID=UPI001CCBB029|nr:MULTISPECIES: exodeoxyribonuclease V subunit beta [unclassified Modicisalibacter]MBZ9559708.1 exodeoxyribonuclease V subunit beta [Modicisalibacter sp. R2A 31.J]MBZ9577160.1 exodeoxyribonuclease V subunit beta [Modicisalibacter sp. MOD 31.J]